MTLITLGPEGTFSHDLALKFDPEVILVSSIRKIFREVMKTGLSGLVPLENSEAGGVVATMDGLMEHPVYITSETYVGISHTFASDSRPEDISVIYAHPQSHEQCSKYIDNLGAPVIHTESNSASAIAQKKRSGSAAVISKRLAEQYGIPVIKEHIENNTENTTRFITIQRDPVKYEHAEKCSLIIDPGKNRAGLLYDLLSPFKEGGVNLTRIESRPSKRSMGTYVFFIDLECDGKWKDAVESLKSITMVKELGCYSTIGDLPCR
jgi:prephenate dehydratase